MHKSYDPQSFNIGRWLRGRPRFLERAYQVAEWIFDRIGPWIERLGYEKVEPWIRPAEKLSKEIVFDCRMCGQCILHATGMTCPMTCPKNLRNGPCGGVRPNGHCEVIPEMRCVWVEAYERSLEMPSYGHQMSYLQPPVNRQLEGRSAWITLLSKEDQPATTGWVDVSDINIQAR
jgi:hypothetical protein